ncbi:hypothetical protein [Methylobacillus sp. Pita1]|uniref:hypothetical protein n=1 Tax=Methylobacillus sp. Pita1 TaxID=3382642 RepID=UPI0038B6514A
MLLKAMVMAVRIFFGAIGAGATAVLMVFVSGLCISNLAFQSIQQAVRKHDRGFPKPGKRNGRHIL